MRSMVVVVMAMLASACLQEPTVECGEHVCPAGYSCAGTSCASPAQQLACEGLADGMACSFGVTDGECQSGACIAGRCGDGIVEGAEVCDDGNEISLDGCNSTCTSDESCGNGLVEVDEECDCGTAPNAVQAPSCVNTLNGGEVCASTCRRRRCGDGEVFGLETCDDGNVEPGDGCSYDCRSTEVCGNGTIDFTVGELCDDVNTRNRDGCSGTCIPEVTAWTLDQPRGQVPPAGALPAVAYDSGRRRYVMFGGYVSNGDTVNDTWELTDDGWDRVTTVHRPSRREGASMVYDAGRARIVLFGGTDGSNNYFDETWEFDGIDWRQVATSVSPSARHRAMISYDSARARVVLFGGSAPIGGVLGDTWEYDGQTWTQMSPATSPQPRARAGIAYDPKRGRAVMFGGWSSDLTYLAETWAYDGMTWSQLTDGPTPGARIAAAMAYHPGRGRIVMFGGIGVAPPPIPDPAPPPPRYRDTWEHDGDVWISRSPAGPPPARDAAGIAYDDARAAIVLTHGETGTARLGDQWTYSDTGAWSLLTFAAGPTGRRASSFAYDAARGQIVMFGGRPTGAPVAETWVYDGAWKAVTPQGTLPPAGEDHAMAYDAFRGIAVMFGGISGSGAVADTWEWNGSSWTERTGVSPPAARYDHAMAYDPIRRRVVLFGGLAGTLSDETWEYDGTAWTQMTPTASPSARRGHAMVYDPARNAVVLFGGRVSPGSTADVANDMWAWNGTIWTEIVVGDIRPQKRTNHAMTYDADGARIVLFGGDVQATRLDDTWVLRAEKWERLDLPVGPAPRGRAVLAHHAALGSMVLFGGEEPSVQPYGDTWQLNYVAVQPLEGCSTGFDIDHDGLRGCDDDSCRGVCTPMCPAETSCDVSPRCGDGTCSPVETCRACPADCMTGTAACPILCGDRYCDPPENASTCPGDCP